MYYAVKQGHKKGIYTSWNDCKMHVIGYAGAKFKKFKTLHSAQLYLGIITDDERVSDDIIYVYTDGSCTPNRSGYGIYIPSMNIKLGCKIYDGATNNVAELSALLGLYPFINPELKYCIYTDSKYCIWAAHKSHEGHIHKNVNLVKSVNRLYRNMKNVRFVWIAAHTNELDKHSVGNSIADKLSRS